MTTRTSVQNKETRTERLIRRFKNNKVISIVVLLGTIVIGLDTFKDALMKLSKPVFEVKPSPTAKIQIWMLSCRRAIQNMISHLTRMFPKLNSIFASRTQAT